MNPHTLQHALETAFTWTWQISLRATVVIAFVLLVQLAFRKILTPRWSYVLGLLMLLRLLLPFAPASPMSIFNLGGRFAARPAVQLETPPVSAMPSTTITADFTPAAIAVPATPPSIVSPAAPIAKSHPKTVLNYHLIAAGLWLAGCLGMLALVARQHRRFILALRRWEPVTEPRVLGLLGDCRAALGVTRRVTLLAATGPGTPALFGIMNPRMLIPADMLRQLDDRELRHIFLHELIHLRHGDVLLNWVMILVRSLHWFNPAVWLAMKKLRADQELACDAAVMARLADDERRQYGGTLLKLLGDFSAARPTPGFVPFITNKRTIKRRIVMISKFKPAGRVAVAASLALLIALGCFTFTRAAEQAKTAQSPETGPVYVTIGPDGLIHVGNEPKAVSLEQLKQTLRSGIGTNPKLSLIIRADKKAPFNQLVKVMDAAQEVKVETVSLTTHEGAESEEVRTGKKGTLSLQSARILDMAQSVGVINQEITNFERQIAKQQKIVDELREKLRVVETDSPAPGSALTLPTESLLTIQNRKTELEIQGASLEIMLTQLKKLRPEDLRQALTTALPDTILTTLLQDRNSAESVLVKQRTSMGENNPEVMVTKQLIETTDRQIDERIKGLLNGLQLQIDSKRREVEELETMIASARERDLETMVRTRPYYVEKKKLEQLKRIMEVLFFRTGQENMNLNMPTNGSVK